MQKNGKLMGCLRLR